MGDYGVVLGEDGEDEGGGTGGEVVEVAGREGLKEGYEDGGDDGCEDGCDYEEGLYRRALEDRAR